MNHKKTYHCSTCTCNDSEYETFNIIHKDSIAHYTAPLDELRGGKLFVSLDSISEEERNELWKRLGPRHDVMEDDF
jgi:hypothetical protein